ncbi:MAG TPA: rRNA maturation RNase YbeY, partial [Candidatus Sulfotelmatobacter sp.]|nr:rRNA maturation RNase YbeY [Candidatus Sulfotelmatobacter sp.]
MFETLVGKIVKGEKRKGQVDVSLVNDKVIKVLNRKFRKKDKATDVLAFPYSEGTGTGIGDILGDVIISRETARKNARHFGFTYQE